MNKTSPTSAKPNKKTGFLASRKQIFGLLAVIGLGVALVYASGSLAQAQNAKKGGKKNDTTSAKKVEKTSTPKKEVKPALQGKADFQTMAKTIDQLIGAELKKNEIDASPRCTDEEYVRRVNLDLVGVIPTPEDVTKFLNSKEPNKRSKLVDELLANPRYGKFFGELWTKQLLPKDSMTRKLGEGPMLTWMSDHLNKNTPWNKIVSDVVTATGPQDQNGAVTFFIANPAPEKMTDQITQRFLGVQLQCAQCHNHPFTDYKQTEYWGMAAFFMNVNISANPNQAAKQGKSIVVSENTTGKKGKKLKLPMEAKIVPAKFLKGEEPKLAKTEPSRPVLAQWMTSKSNPYFSRAAANRIWHHLMGRGIVNPVDDMHDDNPASHPELLATLADQFKQNDFDLKYLVRAICASETYQRSSKVTGNNGDDHELFSHAFVRAMHPEQLFDSLTQVIGNQPGVADGAKKKAVKNQPVGARAKFVDFFTGDDGYKPLEFQVGIPQALLLMNSKQLGNTTKAVNQAMKQVKTPEGVIEYLFLSTFSRRPTSSEVQRMVQYAQKQGTPQTAYSDILWALLNSSEFYLNH